MLVYLIASVSSIFFAYLSHRFSSHNKKLLILALDYHLQMHESRKKAIQQFFTIGLNKKVMVDHFFTFLAFLPLFIVSSIRYLVGTDYDGTYKTIYDYTYKDGYQFKLTGETLYGALNQIASLYSGSDYVGVFVLSSLMVCSFIIIGLKKQSVNFTYSVLLFIISGYYFWSFNAVRQMIAMAIFVYAFQFIIKSQPWKYFVCILFAAGFHTMALIYLPMYFLKKIKMSFKFILFLVIVCASSADYFRSLVYFVVVKIEIFNLYAIRYLDNFQFASYTESSIYHMFINLSFLVLYMIIAQIYDKGQEKSSIWVMFQFLAFAFSSLSSELPLANRISRLFAVVQLLSIPYMTSLIADKRLRIMINFSIIVCWLTYSFVTFYILRYHDVFPYQTIFNR